MAAPYSSLIPRSAMDEFRMAVAAVCALCDAMLA